MGGKYLKKANDPMVVPKTGVAKKAGGAKRHGKGMKVLLIVLAVVVVLGVAGFILARQITMMYAGVTTKTDDAPVPSVPSGAVVSEGAVEGQVGVSQDAVDETIAWSGVVATQNVTTIMLVGQDHREGQEQYLPDTMIMCTIDRDSNTLTMTSIMCDIYVPLPAYEDQSPGQDRINMCYDLGTEWSGTVNGGMEMLSLCVEQNLGIHIDHTIEVDHVAFEQVIDLVGGVDITLTQAEADYLNMEETHKEWSYYPDHEFVEGPQTLNGMDALAYSRICKIDDDFERTVRQRTVMDSLIKKCKTIGLWDLHKIATEIVPLVTTDMTDDEITNYIWEFIPMLMDLRVESQRIPLEKEQLSGEWSYTVKEVEDIGSVLELNLVAHKKYLQELLGYADVVE